MKKLVLLLITLITLINVSYASFPVENKITEISNQIDYTTWDEKMPPTPGMIMRFVGGILLLILLIGGLVYGGILLYRLLRKEYKESPIKFWISIGLSIIILYFLPFFFLEGPVGM